MTAQEDKDTAHLPKLSHKQLGAVRHYIMHGNKTEAYRKNYDCSKMKPESIQRKAVELFDNGKVAAWVEHYQKKEAKEFSLTVEDKKRMLLAGAKLGLKMRKDGHGNLIPISISGMKECISELNRMEGDHAPTKQDPLQVIYKTESLLDGIDLEKLSEKELDTLQSAIDTINGFRTVAGGESQAKPA